MKGNRFFKKIDRYLGIPLVFLAGLFCGLLDMITRPSLRPLSPGDRVLVVKLSALGDTLLLLPLFKALRQKIGKEGRILMVATSINKDALEGFPYVDETRILDFGLLLKNPAALWRFFRKLRGFKPLFSLDFDQWLRISPLLCFLSGSPRRYGFKTNGQHRHFLYTKTAPNAIGTHETRQFAAVAALTGVETGTIENFNGFLKREDLFKGGSLEPPQEGMRRIHFHPGCGSSGWQRAWPEESYVQLAQALSKATKVEIRITGMGRYEEDMVHRIIRESGIPLKDCSGRLEMTQLAGLLREADLVVCGNTGLMHLAAGLDRPLIALHGPTDPVKWGPAASGKDARVKVVSAGLLCSPCLNLGFEYGCPYRSCMEAIEVETVLKECLALLKTP